MTITDHLHSYLVLHKQCTPEQLADHERIIAAYAAARAISVTEASRDLLDALVEGAFRGYRIACNGASREAAVL